MLNKYKNTKKMMYGARKLMKMLMFIIITSCIVLTGCIFGGTYTREGNTATFMYSGDVLGTATVSGNTMIGELVDTSFTATRQNIENNNFAGVWTGTEPVNECAFGNTIWFKYPFEDYVLAEVYTKDANIASLGGYMTDITGNATVSGNRLSVEIDDESFSFTKSSSSQNPFIGTWIGTNDEGNAIEIIVGETAWAVRLFE